MKCEKGNKGEVLLVERMQEWNTLAPLAAKPFPIALFAEKIQILICKFNSNSPSHLMSKGSSHLLLRYGKRSAQEDVVAELLFGSDSNRDQRSR